MEDTYRHKGMRRRLVETLREKGIQNADVLAAIGAVPRHFFLDKAFEEQAYEDKAFPIDVGQTISQPYTVAYQSTLLELNKREKVLEIGTGSGYQASVLAMLGARVYTIERQKKLYDKAKQTLAQMNIQGVHFFFKDGYLGLPEFAPFDKILVTAAASEKPTLLLQQLSIGGKMVIPLGDETSQKMYRITRLSVNEFQDEVFHDFKFVPFLRGTNNS